MRRFVAIQSCDVVIVKCFDLEVHGVLLADMVKDFLICHALFNQPLSHMSLDRLQHFVP
jgi:hypothetical protein